MLKRCFHIRRPQRYLCTNVQKARSPSLRASIASNIAKHFNDVSLVDFPLRKDSDFDLTKYKDIFQAHERCFEQHLDDNPNYYPSVSTILNQTMPFESLEALKKWEEEKVKQLGLEGFQKYRKELFVRGRLLHSNIRTYLETKDSSQLHFTSQTQENMWKSVEHVLPNINKLYATEYSVYHPILKFRGILDCIAQYHDVPTVLEWKTSEKIKPTVAHTYDNPLQAIAYYSCLQHCTLLNSDIPNIQEVILVIAYENGTKANIHILEPSFQNTVWRKFLKRLELYWSKNA